MNAASQSSSVISDICRCSLFCCRLPPSYLKVSLLHAECALWGNASFEGFDSYDRGKNHRIQRTGQGAARHPPTHPLTPTHNGAFATFRPEKWLQSWDTEKINRIYLKIHENYCYVLRFLSVLSNYLINCLVNMHIMGLFRHVPWRVCVLVPTYTFYHLQRTVWGLIHGLRWRLELVYVGFRGLLRTRVQT